MKDIDPEVARLLDDIPKSKLPQPLIDEGWGQHSMARMEYWNGKTAKKPETEQAPTYMETCVQCGRPVTNARKGGGWWDHSGGTVCDGALVEDQEYDEHVTQSYLDEVRAYRDRTVHRDVEHVPHPHIQDIQRRLERVRQTDKKFQDLVKQTAKKAAQAKARREAPCGANKHGASCTHQCSQNGDHFGFHECRYCRHLWS